MSWLKTPYGLTLGVVAVALALCCLGTSLTSGRGSPSTPPAPTATTQPQQLVHYQNCDEVKAAGVAPLRSTDPGYRAALDRNNDGWACE